MSTQAIHCFIFVSDLHREMSFVYCGASLDNPRHSMTTTLPEESPLPTLRSPLKVSAFARLIGISKVTIYRMIKEGQLRAIRIRGTLMIPASEACRVAEQGTANSQE